MQDAYEGTQKTLHLQGLDAQTGASTGTELQVRIPVGVFAGQSIRLAGRGSAGSGGAAAQLAGDLYLELQVVLPSAESSAGQEAYAAMARAFPDFQPRA